MNPIRLAAWQWADYDRFHQDRGNFILHCIAVPCFWLGLIALAVGLAVGAWWWAAVGLALVVLSLVAQGRGHRREVTPPIPFSSPGNAVARLLLEQLVTFPRFVLSGRACARQRVGDGDRPVR